MNGGVLIMWVLLGVFIAACLIAVAETRLRRAADRIQEILADAQDRRDQPPGRHRDDTPRSSFRYWQ